MQRRSFLQSLLTLPAVAVTVPNGPPKPIYFLLYSRFHDHLHPDFALQWTKRNLPVLRELRRAAPQAHLSWLVQVSGASAEVFQDLEKGAGIIRTLRDAADEGLVEFGYEGSEEPTPRWRPMPNFRKGDAPEARWQARMEAAEWFLTEYKHPVTGEPDPRRAGGLLRARQVFGDPVWISGYSQELGRDSEWVHLFRKWNLNAVLPGTPEAASFPARTLHGYAGSIAELGKLVSPRPEDVPEIFIQDGFPRVSRATHRTMSSIRLCDGQEAVEKALAALDRSRPHLLQIELGHPHLFLRPDAPAPMRESPLLSAYNDPKNARLPMSALRAGAELEAAFAAEEQTLRWLVKACQEEESGNRCLSATAILDAIRKGAAGHAEDPRETTLSPEGAVSPRTVRRLAQHLVEVWGNNTFSPAWGEAEGRYFTLAESFGLLASVLLSPASNEPVPLLPVYGPEIISLDLGIAQHSVSREALASALRPWVSRLKAGWQPYPAARIPAGFSVGSITLNPAQVLRAMADLVSQPDLAAQPVRFCSTYSALGPAFPVSVRLPEIGALWTVKPAPLAL
jgi:hypothetical protein